MHTSRGRNSNSVSLYITSQIHVVGVLEREQSDSGVAVGVERCNWLTHRPIGTIGMWEVGNYFTTLQFDVILNILLHVCFRLRKVFCSCRSSEKSSLDNVVTAAYWLTAPVCWLVKPSFGLVQFYVGCRDGWHVEITVIQGLQMVIQLNQLQLIALGHHHKHPVRHSIHLSMFYTLHYV